MQAERLIAMDTSTKTLAVSMLEGNCETASVQIEANRNHSIQLVPVIQSMMAEQGWQFNELRGIAVGLGPGSYTGIRIGVTVAKTMAWARSLPVLGVSSLSALALPFLLDSSSAWVVPLMDGRRGQVYTALYTKPFEQATQEDGIRLLSEWLGDLQESLSQTIQLPSAIYFVGETSPFSEQLLLFAERIHFQYGVKVEIVKTEMQALHVGLLGQYSLRQQKPEHAHRLVPNYTQLAEAEKKLILKRQQGEA